MKTKNIIQSAADIIKIISLKKGDVVKMIESGSYSSPESSYAVVLDLLNDGENTYIELLKYKKSYNSVEAEIKLYKGTDDITLFPTSLSELKNHFQEAISKVEEDIKKDKEDLQKKIEALEKAKEFSSGQLSRTLSEVEFQTVTRAEEAEEKGTIKSLSNWSINQ